MDSRPAGTGYTRVDHVEQALIAEVSDRRFLPHLVLHETEAWVFAAADQLEAFRSESGLATKLKHDSATAGGPELVNDNPKTAPSKRLAAYCPGYMKTIEGPLAIAELGIELLRPQCPHLDQWLDKIDKLGRGSTVQGI